MTRTRQKQPNPTKMKPGRGKHKGNRFELLVCRKLSSWVSGGERNDLFARNVISGGQFTTSRRRGAARGLPGDVAGIDGQAYPFLDRFVVECKHHKAISLESFLLSPLRRSYIGGVYRDTSRQAKEQRKCALVIFRQNFSQIMIVIGYDASPLVIEALREYRGIPYVTSHHDSNGVGLLTMRFGDFLEFVDPKALTMEG